MTLDQLRIFVEVAERRHLTRGAAAVGLTPSAVSSAIRALEANHGVALFDRIGRGIALTAAGRTLLPEARELLRKARATTRLLAELSEMTRGELSVFASQTIASYWLPPRLMRFGSLYPGIEIRLTIGNTQGVAQAVREGAADLGFIEGEIEEPDLKVRKVADDRLGVVTAPGHPFAGAGPLDFGELVRGSRWVMRESGSGTRSEFERALRQAGFSPQDLQVALVLPSNEAVLSAIQGGDCAAAISSVAAAPLVEQGRLVVSPIVLPARAFRVLHHPGRQQTKASLAFQTTLTAHS